MSADKPQPAAVALDWDTAVSLFRVIDSTSLVKMMRESDLSTEDVRRALDFWKLCRDLGALDLRESRARPEEGTP